MDRPLEELLYDLDLTPGQSRSKANILRKMAVEDMYKEIERLKKKNEWLLNRCVLRESWTQTICKSDDELEKDILERMQQALSEATLKGE